MADEGTNKAEAGVDKLFADQELFYDSKRYQENSSTAIEHDNNWFDIKQA